MKRFIIAILALAFSGLVKAQTDGYLLYKEYEPDEWVSLTLGDSWYIDINDDSIAEIKWDTWPPASGAILFANAFYSFNDWKACSLVLDHNPSVYLDNNYYFDPLTPLDDSNLLWSNDIYAEIYRAYPNTYPLIYKTGLRYFDGEDYYYGWVEFEQIGNVSNYTYSLHLSRTCFCSIPNYPLRWGQTSLNEGFEETEATAVASIYPNPTKNTFTVTGKALRAAEVINMLGQRVAMVEGQGEVLQIDIANLPAGVYFVRIINEKGQKCVRKVVKE